MSQLHKRWQLNIISGKLTPGSWEILNVFVPPTLMERFYCVRYREDGTVGPVHTGDIHKLEEIEKGWRFVTDSGAEYEVIETGQL